MEIQFLFRDHPHLFIQVDAILLVLQHLLAPEDVLWVEVDAVVADAASDSVCITAFVSNRCQHIGIEHGLFVIFPLLDLECACSR